MNQKNFVVECLEGPEGKRTFIIRELVPNGAPVTRAVCESGDDIATFFDDGKLFNS